MPRGDAKNIDRLALLDELASRPRNERELAEALGFRPDSIRRRLRKLASGRFVSESRSQRGLWEVGPRAGYVLAGAVGSSRINAGVFDPYTRAVAGVATRRSTLLAQHGEDPSVRAIIDRTADMMAGALERAGDRVRADVRAIALALPYGLDPEDGTLLTGEPAENAKDLLAAALGDRKLGLDLETLEWVWASDVAFEGVFEFHFGGPPQQGASPLMLVKLSRNIRSGLVLDGVPWSGIAGDVADLGPLTTWSSASDGKISLSELRDAVSLTRLYCEMTGGAELSLPKAEEMTDAELFDREFRPVLERKGEQGVRARRTMAQAGVMIGRCLDAPIAATSPAAVVITGFLARDESQLRDGLLKVCGHHRTAGTAIELSSGIQAEVRGGVIDTETLDASTRTPVQPQRLPHQYRVAAGAAKLVLEQRLRPALRTSAAGRDRVEATPSPSAARPDSRVTPAAPAQVS